MSAASLLLAVLLLSPCLTAQVESEPAPSFSADSIVNSANGSASSLAPGVLATIYGKNLANTARTPSLGLGAGSLPKELDNVQVFVGGAAAPLLYVSPTQINFLITSDKRVGRMSVEVLRQSLYGGAQVTLVDVAPALFLVDGGKLAVTHVDGKLVSEDTPASAGEIVIAWGAGLGITAPAAAGGDIPRVAGWIVRREEFRVLLDGQLLPSSNVLYAGIAPGFPGLYQINLRLPEIIATKQPELRIGYEGQMSQSGLTLPVSLGTP